jgi:hypothetical protein
MKSPIKYGYSNGFRDMVFACLGNKSKNKLFHITVTKAIPKFAITTADVSTLEKVAKVINLTANKDNVSFVIGSGTDRDKFSLPLFYWQ